MKKLLSLLSVLAISGTAIPTTIAASPYQKQNNNENNKTNILENLNRTKRENNNFKVKSDIYYITGKNYPSKETIPYPITTMYTFTKNEYGRNIGDIYFGTTNGVYLRKAGELRTTKIENIYNSIALIQYHGNGSVHIIDNQGKIYWVSPNGNTRADNDVPYPVTTMYTFTKNEYGRNIGDIYFGTTNGVYLRKSGSTTKINGIDKPIAIIQPYTDINNSVHVVTKTGEVYYLNGESYVDKQTDVPYPVTTMYTFTKNEYGRNIGDIYFGTTNGVYLRKSGSTTKINGIDGIIIYIKPYTDNKNSVHIINLILNKNLLEKRQYNNRLVINNNDDESKPVISNILNNDYTNIELERNIRVTSRGFNDYRQSFADVIANLLLTNNNNNNNNNNFIQNNNNWWTINPQAGHFIIEVSFTQSSSTSNRLELVFNRQNLYLTGFIIRNQINESSNYYYFSDHDNIQRIDNVNNNTSLGFGGSYGELLRSDDLEISWGHIRNAFNSLQNYNHNSRNENALRQDLARIILVTSEAMRFGNRIFSRIGETTQFFNTYDRQKCEFFSWKEGYEKILKNWGTISDLARNREMNRPSNTNKNDWNNFLLAIIYLTIAKNPTNRQ